MQLDFLDQSSRLPANCAVYAYRWVICGVGLIHDAIQITSAVLGFNNFYIFELRVFRLTQRLCRDLMVLGDISQMCMKTGGA